ncbi:hypothetical protein ACLOJK_011607 [Asimina triloba]
MCLRQIKKLGGPNKKSTRQASTGERTKELARKNRDVVEEEMIRAGGCAFSLAGSQRWFQVPTTRQLWGFRETQYKGFREEEDYTKRWKEGPIQNPTASCSAATAAIVAADCKGCDARTLAIAPPACSDKDDEELEEGIQRLR